MSRDLKRVALDEAWPKLVELLFRAGVRIPPTPPPMSMGHALRVSFDVVAGALYELGRVHGRDEALRVSEEAVRDWGEARLELEFHEGHPDRKRELGVQARAGLACADVVAAIPKAPGTASELQRAIARGIGH